MSPVLIFISGAVLVPVLIGVVVGVVMRPWEQWKDTLQVAAVALGVVVGLLLLAIFVGLVADPSECTRTGCSESDSAAAVQAVLVVPLMVPIYALTLPGAAIGKLLGRRVRPAPSGPRGGPA
jgi:cytochrome c biogenesis protein CcdA